MNRQQEIGGVLSLVGAGLGALFIAYAYSTTDGAASSLFLKVAGFCFGCALLRTALAGLRAMFFPETR